MTVLRFPRDRYTVMTTNVETVAVYCSACPAATERVFETPVIVDLADLADAVYVHERMHHGG